MPPQIGVSEVVLRTSQFAVLRDFYTLVLNQPPSLDIVPEPKEDLATPGPLDLPSHIAFFNMYADYPYTQRIALFECGATGDDSLAVKAATGLHHFQLRMADIEELFEAHVRLKAGGHTPAQSLNHGSSTSFYYKDPDGNVVELSCVNFPTPQETQQYMTTPAYQRNPEGFEIDPDDIARRAEAGGKLSELVWEK